MLSPETWAMIGKEMLNTLYMAGFSTLFGYILGLPWGIVLAVTDTEGIRPNKVIYRVLDIITNIMRSIPFLILLILIGSTECSLNHFTASSLPSSPVVLGNS